MIYSVTEPNLSLEEAAWRFLQSQYDDADQAARMARTGYVEKILGANPGLALAIAAFGDSLPIGTEILMPDLPDTDEFQTVNLWE